ncbi:MULTISPECIES: Mu transposase C-terminal domain-containing protein [Nitrosomonas]|uniref:Putative transposase n=1 Tax=Nitrosomonas communis TaxID=44574 RepID=A0A5D3YCP4_9PROT|nr:MULTISPECIES: Mu transposase C-terminal domain-containing protein [Nitrosomonas]TYP83911.1 putative transposase [Nitrosomonas communis]UVS61974.1 Mu transposase C-terminal domain-containing protein [Nitrosomonas sp. PLL12]
MSTIKTHYSCSELVEMKLPGLPSSERRMRDRVKKDGWESIQMSGKGGRGGLRTEYQPPASIMAIIKERALQALIQSTPTPTATIVAQSQPITPNAVTETVKPGDLKDWQRQIAEARAAICSEVRRLETVGGTERAIRTVIDLAARGQLPPQLQKLVPVANAKAGMDRALSRTTLYRWLKESKRKEATGSSVALLAPKARESADIPPWAPYLLSLYRQPQKPDLSYCVEQLPSILPPIIIPPSYSAAYRFLQKMSKTELQRGRMGNRELKKILPFVRRDTSHMWPTTAYTADGHTFDAEVAHPAHGRAFRPEITTVMDIATRKVVGWSAGLAESAWAVLDALRHACLSCGIPSIFYVDNGSGYKNAMMSDEATGFMHRLNIELTHSLPYNSQARGIIERAHQTIWVRAAKMLPTYIGAQMDSEARQKVYKLTRSDIKKSGTSRHLMEWKAFIDWCQQQINDYENHPHRALPKVRDQDGRLRHQTPNEAWAQAIKEGFEPVNVDPHEAEDLFRPYKTCKITRGEIRLFGNLYFHRDLEHYHGETARVGYDIHDASRVWVRDRTGRLICIAEFEANKRSYFPQSFEERAAQKRAEGRIKRAQAKIDEAEAELNPMHSIEYQPVNELTAIQLNPLSQTEKVAIENIAPLPERPGVRPWFTSDIQQYRWLMQNKDDWKKEDVDFLLRYVDSEQYFDLLERYSYQGVAWTEADDKRAANLKKLEESATQ